MKVGVNLPIYSLVSLFIFLSNYVYIVNCLSVLFVLHDLAIGGGPISILQEVRQMRSLGYDVAISIPAEAAGGKPFEVVKSIFPTVDYELFSSMIRIHNGQARFPYETSQEFISIAKDYDIVVATMCLTMSAVIDAVKMYPHIMPAYYVQDYEPWFFYSTFDSVPALTQPKNRTDRAAMRMYEKSVKKRLLKDSLYEFAVSSYQAFNGSIYMFAKTNWLVDTISNNYPNANIYKVVPSIDHETYHHDSQLINIKKSKTFDKSDTFYILAMLRPRSPRRNALGTLDVILRLLYDFRFSIRVTLFGCQEETIYQLLHSLVETYGQEKHRKRGFLQKSNVEMIGVVSGRAMMAKLFMKSDVFIDMSWWQAFGRTGVEAMTCGCIPVLPIVGAAPEICENGKACLYHDGNDVIGFYKVVVRLLANNERKGDILERGLVRSQDFTIEKAAISILNGFEREYKKRKTRSIV